MTGAINFPSPSQNYSEIFGSCLFNGRPIIGLEAWPTGATAMEKSPGALAKRCTPKTVKRKPSRRCSAPNCREVKHLFRMPSNAYVAHMWERFSVDCSDGGTFTPGKDTFQLCFHHFTADQFSNYEKSVCHLSLEGVCQSVGIAL